MQFVEAFKKLGYMLEDQRRDWSAEKLDGVCTTIWKKEVNWSPPPPFWDLFSIYPDGGKWQSSPSAPKRTRHLARALDELDGWLDAIILSGEPDESYGDAEIWEPTRRKGYRWRVTKLDRATGLFRVEAVNNIQKAQ